MRTYDLETQNLVRSGGEPAPPGWGPRRCVRVCVRTRLCLCVPACLPRIYSQPVSCTSQRCAWAGCPHHCTPHPSWPPPPPRALQAARIAPQGTRTPSTPPTPTKKRLRGFCGRWARGCDLLPARRPHGAAWLAGMLCPPTRLPGCLPACGEGLWAGLIPPLPRCSTGSTSLSRWSASPSIMSSPQCG